jgi:hypothetical protein
MASHDSCSVPAVAGDAAAGSTRPGTLVQSYYLPKPSLPSLKRPTSLSRSSWTHPPCQHPCTRPLSCGHPCGSSCHAGKPCPPCRTPCPVSCSHSRCSRRCSEPCPPCAEPCPWQCEHQGSCSLPCGAPCDRLPCNKRCGKKLKCGHQCPGLCGETCLEGCCVVDKCKKKAKPQLLDQVRLRGIQGSGEHFTCADTNVPGD